MINKDKLKEYSEKYGVSLDDMALDRFDYLCQRLLRWNEHVNLTAITDPNEIVIKHFVDSLTLIPYANLPEGASVIDVGCGAGFPGLPIIIKRPDLNITFLDSVGKTRSATAGFWAISCTQGPRSFRTKSNTGKGLTLPSAVLLRRLISWRNTACRL